MTVNYDVLISVASWEDRFREGVLETLLNHHIRSVGVLYSEKYKPQTESNRAALVSICKKNELSYFDKEIDLADTPQTWKGIQTWLQSLVTTEANVLFDISTSPREITWFVLHHLRAINCKIFYHYYRPQIYGEWQSRDALLPRLVFRRSGITFPDKPTAIVAITGFDSDRVAQIINRYEPALVLLGVQHGKQYDNADRNNAVHREKFGSNPTVRFFEIDAYAPPSELVHTLQSQLHELFKTYNILTTSLGPKPSAVGLFKLTEKFPDVGLIYTPSLEYNAGYSKGIDLDSKCSGKIYEA